MLQTNLAVFRYLHDYPSAPADKLPGVIQWTSANAIVKAPMLFEEEAEIENRFAQHLLGRKHEGNEQPAHLAIAIEERMDRFELRMCYTFGHVQPS